MLTKNKNVELEYLYNFTFFFQKEYRGKSKTNKTKTFLFRFTVNRPIDELTLDSRSSNNISQRTQRNEPIIHIDVYDVCKVTQLGKCLERVSKYRILYKGQVCFIKRVHLISTFVSRYETVDGNSYFLTSNNQGIKPTNDAKFDRISLANNTF